MKWCNACVLPDSRPHLEIDATGTCNACKSHNTKADIDWSAREDAFYTLVNGIKKQNKHYDCVIPVSGGKDSTWQVIKCLEYGLRPLAVTWKSPARTQIGRENLENMVSLGVDHIDYQINPKVEARFMFKTFKRFGSTAIPMHMAIYNIPLNIAVRFDIPLVVWGENSAFEYGDKKDIHTGFKLDHEWLMTYGVTQGTTAGDWVDNELSAGDLTAYFGPTPNDLDDNGIRAIFLGYYFPWDPESSFRIAEQNGFKANSNGARTGYYDYADIDDDFIAIHHWMKWYKFGFTRLFDNLSLEIRNGRLTREQAIDIIRNQADDAPIHDIEKFCGFAGISMAQFYAIAQRFRNQKVWTKRDDGVWSIANFIISEWNWI